MMMKNEDIYEYQFNSLYECVHSLIGKSTIRVIEDEYDKLVEDEVKEFEKDSRLLFDISGSDFNKFKQIDSEYRYWVEVYIIKIIENLMSKYDIPYEEKYYSGSREQHSIICNIKGKTVEAYFLFDIEYEEGKHSSYDTIAKSIKSRSSNVDEINIFLFRENINYLTLGDLINRESQYNENGYVRVLSLAYFFEHIFSEEEYKVFFEYAKAFNAKCNRIISYKTVITPTKNTLDAFKQKKEEMLMTENYKRIAEKGLSGELNDEEFEKVNNHFIDDKMYLAMTSTNDFADSFISAEWSFDVYKNAMGELELTGIIAGFLKSIEQLLFAITKFHKDKGFKIKMKNSGGDNTARYQEYSSKNEEDIDSTLWSLNKFITTQKNQLALSRKICGCIGKAVNLWREYQRNGYFHKHNLYLKDNKIAEVRELTLYLYFLILGGIKYTQEEKASLGVFEKKSGIDQKYDEEYLYKRFKKWFDNVFEYNTNGEIPGLWFLLTKQESQWLARPYLMKNFRYWDFENRDLTLDSTFIEMSHTKDIPAFAWLSDDSDYSKASTLIRKMFDKYFVDNPNRKERIGAVLSGIDEKLQLIYYRE